MYCNLDFISISLMENSGASRDLQGDKYGKSQAAARDAWVLVAFVLLPW